MSSLAEYLKDNLFKTFADNRKVLEPAWERNKDAYDMTGDRVSQQIGVGNKKSDKDEEDEWRSKSVADLTRVKTNAGKILVCDVLLAGGKIPFRLKEQRVTNSIAERLLAKVGANAQMDTDLHGPIQTGAEMPVDGEMPADAAPPEEAAQMPEQQEMNANLLMNELIQEQLIEAQADAALKRAVKDAAIYGEGVSRIFAGQTKRTAFKNVGGVWQEQTIVSQSLKMRHVPIWDFFTDLEDHDIQNNLGVFERRIMSWHDVVENFSDAAGNEYNIKGSLDELRSHINADDHEYGNSSTRDNESPHIREINKRKKNLQVLEFFGRVPWKYVAELDARERREHTDGHGPTQTDTDLTRMAGELGTAREDVEIMAVVVEETLVRFAVMEKGMRPFVRIAWEEPADSLRGTGVADACSAAQQGLDSGVRLFEDNKKITGNATFAKKSIYLANQHDQKGFYPGKDIELDAACDDVRRAIQPIQFPDVGATLLDLIKLYRESGNEASMIPEISHGVAPSNNTTAYEVSVRNEKAGKYISDVVRGIDDNWIEPVAMFFYRWNMLDPEIPEEFKGAFSVEPMGFSSYNDRVLRMSNLKDILTVCLSNQFLMEKVNLSALIAELMRSNDLDPEQFMNPEGEQMNPMLQQLTEQIGQKFQQIDQTLGELMKALPALSQKSELDAAEQQAKIEKLQAETQRIMDTTELEVEKEKTKRAGLIANIEAKNEELDQKGALNALQSEQQSVGRDSDSVNS
jgi:hypothetical protein